MKKFLGVLFVCLLVVFGYLFFNQKPSEKVDKLKLLKSTEIIEAKITDYYVYGNHLHIYGSLDTSNNNINLDNVSLVLKNDDDEYALDVQFKSNNNQLIFVTTDIINNGINLDLLPKGNFYLFIKYFDGEVEKYYTLVNSTKYDDIEYYTITKNNKNNKINIKFENVDDDERRINYLIFNIEDTNLPSDVYDITIDPGHGGVDSGATKKYNGITYTEEDITLEIALKLKKELEKKGYKVLLTRDKDMDLDYYGDNGRATLPNKYHTKLCLSLHLNSESSKMTYGGVEVYVPNDIDDELASLIATNIANETGVGYSKKIHNKINNGVYFHYFEESDIINANKENIEKGLKANDIDVGAPQMYMIREVGGLATHAYVDGRNEKYGLNPYYQSNQTAESYLIELAYISFNDDIEKIINDQPLFVDAIKMAIITYFE